jgi:hypothetical protein
VLTNPGAARRLGPPARGLQPWHSLDLPAGDGKAALTVQAVPAVHGPADGARDAGGYANCEVTGFVISGPDVAAVYLSGDNASIAVVQDISQRVGVIDVAVLFAEAGIATSSPAPHTERGSHPLPPAGDGYRRIVATIRQPGAVAARVPTDARDEDPQTSMPGRPPHARGLEPLARAAGEVARNVSRCKIGDDKALDGSETVSGTA